LAEYDLQEIEDLKKAQGHFCGYLQGESSPHPRSRRAILFGALLTAASPLFAQSGRVRLRVTDASGAVIPDAEASLIGKDEKPVRTIKANQDGEILLTDLAIGDARVRVRCTGFDSRVVTVVARNGDEAKIEVSLQVGSVGTVVTVGPGGSEVQATSDRQNSFPILPVRTVEVPPQDPADPLPSPLRDKKHKHWWNFRQ
jgi:hypothetical protein